MKKDHVVISQKKNERNWGRLAANEKKINRESGRWAGKAEIGGNEAMNVCRMMADDQHISINREEKFQENKNDVQPKYQILDPRHELNVKV